MRTETYRTDLTENQMRKLEKFLPSPPKTGRPLRWPISEIISDILYITRSGCAWRLLPHDFPGSGFKLDIFWNLCYTD